MRLILNLTLALLLALGGVFQPVVAAPQESRDPAETEAEVTEDADDEADDEADADDEPLIDLDDPDFADLDRQDYEEDDDGFIPTEEVPADEAIPFPTDI